MSLERFHSWKPASAAPSESRANPGCFDCNICLDYVCDPVATLCGHLYCWPCIYKWFHTQSDTLSSDEHPTCPVCKKKISHTTLVPLYGRGHSPDLKAKAPSPGMAIPPRPQAFGTEILGTASQSGQQLSYRNPYQNLYHEDGYSPSLPYRLNGNTTTGFFHPVIAMFGKMFCTRIFGNSDNVYEYPNSYNFTGSSNSPRMRRQEMQADKSLNRISIFLFCGFLLCLLLF